MIETVCKIIFILMFTVLTVLRVYYKSKYAAFKEAIPYAREGVLTVTIRIVLAIPLFFSLIVYLFFSKRLVWMYLPFPVGIRLGSAVFSVCSLLLLRSTHVALGKDFSTTLIVKEQHRLVTWGPYRYMRHPMYTAYFLLFLSALGISGNWVFGLSGLGIILSLMTIRLQKEEALLIRVYGEEYVAYKQTTRMFIPLPKRTCGERFRFRSIPK